MKIAHKKFIQLGNMKNLPIQVSILPENKGYGLKPNPIFNCIKVCINDEAAGSFLEIIGDDEMNDGAKLTLDWIEWDAIVEVVNKYRKDWEYADDDCARPR